MDGMGSAIAVMGEEYDDVGGGCCALRVLGVAGGLEAEGKIAAATKVGGYERYLLHIGDRDTKRRGAATVFGPVAERFGIASWSHGVDLKLLLY
jgi:hypothetical protein